MRHLSIKDKIQFFYFVQKIKCKLKFNRTESMMNRMTKYSCFQKFYILKRRWSKEVYYLFGFLVIVIISLLIALVVIASTGGKGKIYLLSVILRLNVVTVPVLLGLGRILVGFGFSSEFRKSYGFGLILVFGTIFQFGFALF